MAPTQLTLSREALGGGIFYGVDAITPRDIEKLVHRRLFRIQEAVATMGCTAHTTRLTRDHAITAVVEQWLARGIMEDDAGSITLDDGALILSSRPAWPQICAANSTVEGQGARVFCKRVRTSRPETHFLVGQSARKCTEEKTLQPQPWSGVVAWSQKPTEESKGARRKLGMIDVEKWLNIDVFKADAGWVTASMRPLFSHAREKCQQTVPGSKSGPLGPFGARAWKKVAADTVRITHCQSTDPPAHVACKDLGRGTSHGKNDQVRTHELLAALLRSHISPFPFSSLSLYPSLPLAK
jgi:hypothetical protein